MVLVLVMPMRMCVTVAGRMRISMRMVWGEVAAGTGGCGRMRVGWERHGRERGERGRHRVPLVLL